MQLSKRSVRTAFIRRSVLTAVLCLPAHCGGAAFAQSALELKKENECVKTELAVQTSAKDAAQTSSRDVATITFRELFETTARELKPSKKLLELNGKRIRIVGFMARAEESLDGAFYLCPRPVELDESGGGIGDLPPDSVLVIASAMRGKEIPFTNRALEVFGRLEIGNRTDERGRVSAVRLILDAPTAATTKNASAK